MMDAKVNARTEGRRKVRRKAAPRPKKGAAVVADQYTLPSFMAATNGGGSPEKVPGFDVFRAATAGFETRRIVGPTFLAAKPDGGFFSQGKETRTREERLPSSKPENIIGADSRVIVSETADTPWRCICHLEIEYERGPVGFGTGFLIGTHTVLTAAHVLCDRSYDNWRLPRNARNVRVVPGRNGTLAPYGYFVSSEFRLPDVWTDTNSTVEESRPYDFAAILIPHDHKVLEEPLGQRLGYFGLKAFTEADADKLKLLFVNNAGYPYEASKPYGTLWYNAGRVREIGEDFVEYMVDTEGGQSGSPVYFFDETENQRYVIAVHTTGDFVNRGVRITPKVFQMIRAWAKR